MYWTNRPYKAVCAWEAVQGGRFVQDATAIAPAPKKEGKQLVSPHNEHRDTTQKGATECFNAVCHTLPGGHSYEHRAGKDNNSCHMCDNKCYYPHYAK